MHWVPARAKRRNDRLRSIGVFAAVVFCVALIPVMVFLGNVGALIAAQRPTGFFDVPDAM